MRMMLKKNVAFWNKSRKTSKKGEEIISVKMRKLEYTAKNDCEISILRPTRKMHALLFAFRRTEPADFFLSQIIGFLISYYELSLHNI